MHLPVSPLAPARRTHTWKDSGSRGTDLTRLTHWLLLFLKADSPPWQVDVYLLGDHYLLWLGNMFYLSPFGGRKGREYIMVLREMSCKYIGALSEMYEAFITEEYFEVLNDFTVKHSFTIALQCKCRNWFFVDNYYNL